MTTVYAPKDAAQTLAEQVQAARVAGWTRPALTELTKLTPAQLWRVEHGNAHAHEVEVLTVALAKIASGEVKPPAKAQAERVDVKAVLASYQARIQQLEEQVAALVEAQGRRK
jgi:hypothetical protein